jgi:hypothetical protein
MTTIAELGSFIVRGQVAAAPELPPAATSSWPAPLQPKLRHLMA